jgi:hypothetical protein
VPNTSPAAGKVGKNLQWMNKVQPRISSKTLGPNNTNVDGGWIALEFEMQNVPQHQQQLCLH